jgi:hypothetical protein
VPLAAALSDWSESLAVLVELTNVGETDVKVSNGVATVTTANKHLTFKVG